MSFENIILGYGKQYLNPTKSVGITLRLLNTKVGFEARGGPTWTECTVTDGNLTAIDSAGDPMSPKYSTAFVNLDIEHDVSAALINASVEDFWDALPENHRVLNSFGEFMRKILYRAK